MIRLQQIVEMRMELSRQFSVDTAAPGIRRVPLQRHPRDGEPWHPRLHLIDEPTIVEAQGDGCRAHAIVVQLWFQAGCSR